MQALKNIYPQLTVEKNIVITMHQKPDGDAMGSTLGLYHFLIQFGHTVTVISPTNWAGFLNWMPGCDKVLDYEKFDAKANLLISQADWIFCLDFNTLSRTKNMETPLGQSKREKILIDHHRQPQSEVFAYGESDTTKSSTAEMVYGFIEASGYDNKINTDIAECIYTGIMTDTGSFRFPSTTAGVHKIVAALKEKGLCWWRAIRRLPSKAADTTTAAQWRPSPGTSRCSQLRPAAMMDCSSSEVMFSVGSCSRS